LIPLIDPQIIFIFAAKTIATKILAGSCQLKNKLDTRYWILDTRYSILDTRYWILDTGFSILDISWCTAQGKGLKLGVLLIKIRNPKSQIRNPKGSLVP